MSHAHYPPHEVADPYGNPYPPPKKPYLLYGLIAAVVLGTLCCIGSCIPLAIFGFKIQAEEVGTQVRDIPEFRMEIGELQTIEVNFTKSSSDDDQDGFYYEVRGSEGSGELWVRVRDTAQGRIVREAILRTPTGKRIQLPIR
jgi:hypothetical protein